MIFGSSIPTTTWRQRQRQKIKCWRDPSCAIFLKGRRFEDIKYNTKRWLLGEICGTTCIFDVVFVWKNYLTGLDPLLESPDCSYSLVQLAWWMLGLTFDNWLVLLLRLLAVGLIVTWGCSFYTLVLFSELVCVFTWVGLITSSRSSLIVETVATVMLARGYRVHCVPLHCLKRIPAHKNHQTG